MKLTQKLLGYLGRVFDAGPEQVLLMRMRYDGAMSWRVDEGVLTTTVAGGSGSSLSVTLSAYSLSGLIDFIAAQPGYSVPYSDLTGISSLSGTVLIDGGADQDDSNGDHLHAYTSSLWAYLESQAGEIKLLRTAVDEALLQMSAQTAGGEWVDEHGSYYAVQRVNGESDAAYAARIVAEVGRARGTNVAIGSAIRQATGSVGVAVDDYKTYTTSTSGTKSFGLFDVTVVAEIGGDLTPDEIDANTRSLVESMRDAGTFLRNLRYVFRTTSTLYVGAVMRTGSRVTIGFGTALILDGSWLLDGHEVLDGEL